MKMMVFAMLVCVVGGLGAGLTLATGCNFDTTDEKQSAEQSAALAQAHAQIGMPAISDFAEKRTMKDLYEARDKPLPTHAYIVNELSGCLLYLGPAIGYGLPYGTQYTAPTRAAWTNDRAPNGTQIPQAEPNGLFMPASAEGTWVMLKNPTEDKVQAVYIEPRVLVSPFRLTAQECASKSETASAPTPASSAKK